MIRLLLLDIIGKCGPFVVSYFLRLAYSLCTGKVHIFKIVTVSNDGAWREEIEIEMRNEDGENFTGTVTMTEAKYGLYMTQ